MSFYSARNVNLTIGSGDSLGGIFANQASLSNEAQVDTSRNIDSPVSNNYVINSPLSSSLSLSYYVTGVDPLRSHMGYYDIPISVDFGGLYMNSGYLSNYSFSASPYAPVEVSVEIKFFEPTKGDFSPASSSMDYKKVLLFSDFSFSETGIVNSREVLGLDYKYSRSVDVSYSSQELDETTAVHHVHFGAPSVDVDVKTNDLSVDLPETGIRGQATIELRDSAGNNPEAYHLNGIINSHQTSVSPNELLTRNVRITQSNLGGQPQILSVTPNEIFDKDNLVIVEGKNFGRVENVILLDQSLDFLTTGSTQISFTVPEDAHTGPLVIHTDSGPVYYTGIAVNYPPPEATPTPTPTFE